MDISLRKTVSGGYDLLVTGEAGELLELLPALTRGQLGAVLHYVNGGTDLEAIRTAKVCFGK